jgi:hypothetical protein
VLARRPELARVIGAAWPPVLNEQTGLPHTQDDTLPHTQNDTAAENRKYQDLINTRAISGNRVGWGKEQREDYLGRQPETIPGADPRGQLPTAVGRKPHEYDQRDGMMNPTDAGGEAGAYPIKDVDSNNPESHPGVMGTRGEGQIGAGNNGVRLGPSGTEKPYDDTIDPKARRNRPKDQADTHQTRVVPGDPVGGYGQHPWELDGQNDDLIYGHRTGVDQGQNPAYRKQGMYPHNGPQNFPTGMQNLPTQPVHQDQPEHDLEHHDPLTRVNPQDNPTEAGPRDAPSEYKLDRLRHGPAGPSANLPAKQYSPTAWQIDDRAEIKGDVEEYFGHSRVAREPTPSFGQSREPTGDTELTHDLPDHYKDQQAATMFRNRELSDWAEQKGLDLSGTLQDQLERFGKFTDETKKEFGALVIRKQGQVILDQVQVGQEHEIDIAPTRPLGPDEEILGSMHIHPNSTSFSVWDCLSFLKSDWEHVSILRAADGKIIVMVKTPETVPLQEDPEKLRDQYKDWGNEDFAREFKFSLFTGSPDDLEAVS